MSIRDNLPVPEPTPGEALVKVHLSGICATDLELVTGYYPFKLVFGHEFVGEVVKAPQNSDWIGNRVLGEINIVCGECAACRAGRSHHCANRSVLGIKEKNGSFAEFLTMPLKNLHPVQDNVPDEKAVFTEPMAAALEIQEQVQIHPLDSVLVVGAGRLGQLIARTLSLTGCDLNVVTRHTQQQELLQRCNISTVRENEVEQDKWDTVVEATGSASGFNLARLAVRPLGTIVLKSTYKGEVQVNFSALVVDEISIVGSRCGSFSPALRLLESGKIDPTPLISGRFPVSDALTAFYRAA
ncbi:alcohol dehydrogenase catalytic domain-containing protein [Chloroflexota bacterium]